MKPKLLALALVVCVAALQWTDVFDTSGSEAEEKSTAAAAVDWPNTTAARRARACFDAINANDEATFRRFVKENYSTASLAKRPLDERVSKFMGIRTQLGALKVGEVKSEAAGGVAVIVRSETLGIWLSFSFAFEEEAPHFLLSMRGMPSGPPGQKVRDYNAWNDLAVLLEQVHKDAGAPGIAAAIVKDGKIVDRAVVGVRQKGESDKVELNDRFHIGSVGKSFTATMIGGLVEDQLIGWGDTLGEALPDIEMKPVYRSVTLLQLLQHQGGIQPYTADHPELEQQMASSGLSPTDQRRSLAVRALNEEPVTKPGTRMSYSNAGYAIAAYMAERATKRSWEDLLRERVFKPLKLDTAVYGWPVTAKRSDQPQGHFGSASELRVQKLGEYQLGAFLAPAGDISCSVEDLARYAAFHLNGLKGKDGLLESATVKRLHALPDGDEYGRGYACGWMIDKTPSGKPLHWHAGSAGTFYSRVALFPSSDLAVVLVANSGPFVEPVFRKLTDAIQKRFQEESLAMKD